MSEKIWLEYFFFWRYLFCHHHNLRLIFVAIDEPSSKLLSQFLFNSYFGTSSLRLLKTAHKCLFSLYLLGFPVGFQEPSSNCFLIIFWAYGSSHNVSIGSTSLPKRSRLTKYWIALLLDFFKLGKGSISNLFIQLLV